MYDNQLSYECLNEANESINSKIHIPPLALAEIALKCHTQYCTIICVIIERCGI